LNKTETSCEIELIFALAARFLAQKRRRNAQSDDLMGEGAGSAI